MTRRIALRRRQSCGSEVMARVRAVSPDLPRKAEQQRARMLRLPIGRRKTLSPDIRNAAYPALEVRMLIVPDQLTDADL